jgi:hypothetical protein
VDLPAAASLVANSKAALGSSRFRRIFVVMDGDGGSKGVTTS